VSITSPYRIVVALAVLAALCLLGRPPVAAQAEVDDAQLLHQLESTENEVVQSYMGKSSPNPPRYYSDGQWYAPEGPECWNCYDSAGTAAAVLSDQGLGGEEYARVAIETTDTAIADHQAPDGAFEGSASADAGLTTGFYAVELALNYFELRKALPAATRARWAASLAAAAEYLINSGDTTWYINGNVNLRQTEVLWLAWQVTGNPYFKQQYEQEWAFTIAPPQSRWPGFGLQITTAPTAADGSNGAGYLAESGGGAPGFDPEYTMVQLGTATSMYIFSREARWLRLMNLFYNQIIPLVEVTPPPHSVWNLNATQGARKDELTPFITSALYVLVSGGVRPELEEGLPAQFTTIEDTFHGAMTFTNATLYKDVGGELTMPILDAQWPSGVSGEESPPEGASSEDGVEGRCAPCPSTPPEVPAATTTPEETTSLRALGPGLSASSAATPLLAAERARPVVKSAHKRPRASRASCARARRGKDGATRRGGSRRGAHARSLHRCKGSASSRSKRA